MPVFTVAAGIPRVYAHSSIDWALGALEFLRRGGPKEDKDALELPAFVGVVRAGGPVAVPCVGHDDPTGQTISRQLLMRPELASIIFAIGLLIGFALGYGVRAFVSYRRHQASRRRHYIQ